MRKKERKKNSLQEFIIIMLSVTFLPTKLLPYDFENLKFKSSLDQYLSDNFFPCSVTNIFNRKVSGVDSQIRNTFFV